MQINKATRQELWGHILSATGCDPDFLNYVCIL